MVTLILPAFLAFAECPVGMGPVIGFPQPRHRHVGVDLRRHQPGVPEQFLDGAEIGAAVEQVGRERVSQPVRCQPLRDRSRLHRSNR